MYAVPDDPSRLQAMVFVREFEALADKLVVEIEGHRPHSTEMLQLLAELREVREHIRRLQVSFGLASRHGRETA
ncbi:hypothetical protein [Gordonia rhizosphera]|uniref:Uncharacterized protein n=1 Tax=Gordonia rhizosphera NBRC 16068 TaxID=1108045 RepID=K6VQL3_9ACTN|nr:hypothetical protein [Gordonia rhizosphera]GAB89205.1 hypothetical protein GORHZ_053_00580 [Gordonia rhizosphera NBRC 16068]